MNSGVPTTEQASRAVRSIGLLCDASIAEAQLAELDQLVVQFPQIRRRYVELMSLHADMRQQAALLRPKDSTESSAIDAIVDLVTRERRQNPSAVTRGASASEPTDLRNDLNESMILPAIAETVPDSPEQDVAIDAPLKIIRPLQKRFPWRIVAAVALPLLAVGVFWAMRTHPNLQSSVTLLTRVKTPRDVTGTPRFDVPDQLNSVSATKPSGDNHIVQAQCSINLAINATWSDPHDPAPQTGAALNLGRHDLKSGIVKLALPGNAMVVIEAPARFEVLSRKELRLLEGKLCAQLTKGGGLTVMTPDLKAVDLGTEFALDVSAGKQTHLEVFQGAVRAATTNPVVAEKFKNLVAGDAVLVTTGSPMMEKDTPRPLEFLRPSEVQAADKTAYQRWFRFSQAVREDPDLTAYYPFDAESAAANQLKNRASQTAGMYDGVMGAPGVAKSAPEWIQGRWPGKSALQFGGAQLTAVTINARPELIPETAITICCWIKRADVDKPFHLLTSGVQDKRSFNLGMVRREGSGPMDLIDMTWAAYNVAPSPASFDTHQWKFLAVTSSVQNLTEFYLDGKPISTNKRTSPAPLAVKQLLIGAPAPGKETLTSKSYFNGSMDELLIFRRALAAKEIERLFKIGMPG